MEVKMDTSKITGLALLAPVLAIIAWLIFGIIVMEGVGPDNPQKFIGLLGANSAIVKILFPACTLLFLMALAAVGYIKKSMKGGSGHYIASFGWFLIIIGSAGQLGETALTIATAEAAAVGNMAVASSMFAGSSAIGATTTAFSMLGITLIGIGILQQKNFSQLVAGLMIISGISTMALCMIDYESPLVSIGYIGVVISFAALGVSLLTKKE
jgi:hypothetical protein